MKNRISKILGVGEKYVYPAVFAEEDGKVLYTIVDLPGLHGYGDTWYDAIENAREDMAMWLTIAEDKGEVMPTPTRNLKVSNGVTSNIAVDTLEYRKATSNKAVTRTVTLPSWLSVAAEKNGLSFSQALQEKLREQLGIDNMTITK